MPLAVPALAQAEGPIVGICLIFVLVVIVLTLAQLILFTETPIGGNPVFTPELEPIPTCSAREVGGFVGTGGYSGRDVALPA